MMLVKKSVIFSLVFFTFFSCNEEYIEPIAEEVVVQKASTNNISTGMKELKLDWRTNPRNGNLSLLPMIVFYPDWMDDYNSHIDEVRVNVFMHGVGERGNSIDDLDIIKNHYLPRMLPDVTRNEIYICPQVSGSWTGDNLTRVYDMLKAEFPNALEYGITGLSLGGMGTYNMLAQYPYFFNDAAILCGNMSNPQDKIPMDCSADIIAWHGDADNVVSYSSGKSTIDKLVNAGYQNRCEFVTIKGAKHNIWNHVYYSTSKYFDFVDESSELSGEIPEETDPINDGLNINVRYDNFISEATYQIRDGKWIRLNNMGSYFVESANDSYGFRVYPPESNQTYDIKMQILDLSGKIVDQVEGNNLVQGEPLILYTKEIRNNYTVNFDVLENSQSIPSGSEEDIVINFEYENYYSDAYYQLRDGNWIGINGDNTYSPAELKGTYGLRVICPKSEGMYTVGISLLDTSGKIIEAKTFNNLQNSEAALLYTSNLKSDYTVKYSLTKN